METDRSYSGCLLVASRKLVDPNFRRAVVLIVQHTEDGTLGVILNRPSNASIRHIWGKISDTECDRDEPVLFGGPVHGPLMAIHTQPECSEIEVIPGVHFSVQRENLDQLMNGSEPSIRLFIGHSGWSPGQLESELEEGSWHTAPATIEQVFLPVEDQWEHVLRAIGKSAVLRPLNLDHLPDDPTAN